MVKLGVTFFALLQTILFVCILVFQGLKYFMFQARQRITRLILVILYSLIQMKCQGGNKYALSISVKFDQSTRRFGRIGFACLFEFTKHMALLFYLLSPYERFKKNVRPNMHIIKTIMKFCAHWSTVCGMANSDAGGIQTQ